MAGRTAQVLMPLPLAEPFDYLIPAGLQLDIGDYVQAPFGRRKLMGVVWGLEPASVGVEKLKTIEARQAVPPMPRILIQFIDWVAGYTVSPKGAVLKLSLTADSAQEEVNLRHFAPAPRLPDKLKLTPLRQRVMDAAWDGPSTLMDLARRADSSAGVVQGLIKAGALIPVQVHETPPARPDYTLAGATLSPAQDKAARELVQKVKEERFSITLLEGVTGSGKTEVYAEAIRAGLKQGRQVLVLLPEIALSVQMLERFTSLFGAAPVQWHSDLTMRMRRRAWRAAAQGSAQLVIGARSSLFLPYKNLGLVVVDEEHDQAYKQEEGVSYHARDMAIVRAQLSNIPVILASATPSIESVVNVQEGRYGHVELPERHGGSSLPKVEMVDLLRHPPPRGRWLAPPVVTAMEKNLAAGEQTLLFLNRRGYAPLTLCRACGHRMMCSNCTAWLVEHRAGLHRARLVCHHCDHGEKEPEKCPKCGAKDSFAAVGPGVERIEEETRALFPEARIMTLASDTTSNWRALQAMLQDIQDGRIDIIIGTQIVAKGHHFPHLTLVVVVDADIGLEGGDVRARERTYQLLEQVGGRAGRAALPGTVLMQSQFITNFIFQSLVRNDRKGFIKHEIEERATYHWPPYARLAALIVSGRDQMRAEKVAQEIRKLSVFPEGVEIFGPAPAPLARLKTRHRYRLLVRGPRHVKLQPMLADVLGRLNLPKGIELQIVIDPFTFL